VVSLTFHIVALEPEAIKLGLSILVVFLVWLTERNIVGPAGSVLHPLELDVCVDLAVGNVVECVTDDAPFQFYNDDLDRLPDPCLGRAPKQGLGSHYWPTIPSFRESKLTMGIGMKLFISGSYAYL
jgi:hypothetical protein